MFTIYYQNDQIIKKSYLHIFYLYLVQIILKNTLVHWPLHFNKNILINNKKLTNNAKDSTI